MQKLSASQKGWTGIVIALWIIALVAMMFLMPKSSPSKNAAGDPTPVSEADASGSLASTLGEMEPSNSDAVAGEMIDLRYVYGQDVKAFVPLCSEEPQELIDAKMKAAEGVKDQIDLESGNSYVLLMSNPDEGVDAVDAVPNDAIDLCNGNYFDQFFSTEQGFPVHWDGEKWRFGLRIQ